MQAKLIVVGGDVKTTEVKLKLPCVVGRGRGTGLMLPHPLVSRQHCEIYEHEGQLVVRDLGSLNGTYINNTRLTEPTLLPAGDLLTIGTVTFRAEYGNAGPKPAPSDRTVHSAPGAATLYSPPKTPEEEFTDFGDVDEVAVEEAAEPGLPLGDDDLLPPLAGLDDKEMAMFDEQIAVDIDDIPDAKPTAPAGLADFAPLDSEIPQADTNETLRDEREDDAFLANLGLADTLLPEEDAPTSPPAALPPELPAASPPTDDDLLADLGLDEPAGAAAVINPEPITEDLSDFPDSDLPVEDLLDVGDLSDDVAIVADVEEPIEAVAEEIDLIEEVAIEPPPAVSEEAPPAGEPEVTSESIPAEWSAVEDPVASVEEPVDELLEVEDIALDDELEPVTPVAEPWVESSLSAELAEEPQEEARLAEAQPEPAPEVSPDDFLASLGLEGEAKLDSEAEPAMSVESQAEAELVADEELVSSWGETLVEPPPTEAHELAEPAVAEEPAEEILELDVLELEEVNLVDDLSLEHVGEFAANEAAAVEPEPVALEPVANQPDPVETTDPSWEPQGSDVPLDLPAVDLPVADLPIAAAEPEAPLSAELPAEDAFAAEMLASFEPTEEPLVPQLASEWSEPTVEQPAAAFPADDLESLELDALELDEAFEIEALPPELVASESLPTEEPPAEAASEAAEESGETLGLSDAPAVADTEDAFLADMMAELDSPVVAPTNESTAEVVPEELLADEPSLTPPPVDSWEPIAEFSADEVVLEELGAVEEVLESDELPLAASLDSQPLETEPQAIPVTDEVDFGGAPVAADIAEDPFVNEVLAEMSPEIPEWESPVPAPSGALSEPEFVQQMFADLTPSAESVEEADEMEIEAIEIEEILPDESESASSEPVSEVVEPLATSDVAPPAEVPPAPVAASPPPEVQLPPGTPPLARRPHAAPRPRGTPPGRTPPPGNSPATPPTPSSNGPTAQADAELDAFLKDLGQ